MDVFQTFAVAKVHKNSDIRKKIARFERFFLEKSIYFVSSNYLVEDFADCWMREDDLLELGGGAARPYGERGGSDELRTRIADAMNANNLVISAINNHLTKTRLAFVLRHEPSGEGHRQSANLYRYLHRLRLLLRDAHGCDLGIRINDGWNCQIIYHLGIYHLVIYLFI